MSLDPKQFLKYVIKPALAELSDAGAPHGMYSVAAEQLLMGTAAQESKLRWLHQLGKGPAVGLFQMEPATFFDIRDRFIKTQPYYWNAFGKSVIGLNPDPGELAYNMKLAVLMARLRYAMSPMKLPEAGDISGMAHMWKMVYNTVKGAGKEEDFKRSWAALVVPARIDWGTHA